MRDKIFEELLKVAKSFNNTVQKRAEESQQTDPDRDHEGRHRRGGETFNSQNYLFQVHIMRFTT